MDPRRVLRELGGAARADAILSHGVSWPALRSAHAAGIVVRPAWGTYALPHVEPGVSVAAALRGQLGCLSACAWWGLKSVSKPDSIHVVVPADRNVESKRLRQLGLIGVHRDSTYTEQRLVESVEAAVDHAARCTTPIEQLVLVDSALRQGRLDPMGLDALSRGTVYRRRWLRRLATSIADSPPESVARAVLDAAGLRPRVQELHDRVGRIDLGVGVRHGIEVDGYETHSSRDAFAEDRRRDREMAAQGKWSLRFTYWDVMKDPRAFGLEVARIIGFAVDARFDKRMSWLMAVPAGNVRRRARWSPS